MTYRLWNWTTMTVEEANREAELIERRKHELGYWVGLGTSIAGLGMLMANRGIGRGGFRAGAGLGLGATLGLLVGQARIWLAQRQPASGRRPLTG